MSTSNSGKNQFLLHREGMKHPQKKNLPPFSTSNANYKVPIINTFEHSGEEISAKVNLKYWSESFLPNSKGLCTTHMNVDPKRRLIIGWSDTTVYFHAPSVKSKNRYLSIAAIDLHQQPMKYILLDIYRR